jgi:transposase
MDKIYHTYIGIDIGKFELVMNIHGSKTTYSYSMDVESLTKMYKEHRQSFKNALVVLETTGGYERSVITFLQKRKVAVHRANSRVIKNFIKSYNIIAKSDSMDSIALSLYAAERQGKLELYQPDKHEHLRLLNERRQDIIEMRTQEKNRMQSPLVICHDSYKSIIETFDSELAKIEKEIKSYIDSHPDIKEKIEIAKTVPGVGEKTARIMVASFPELGTINQKEIASMAGVAPHPNQSGKREGYRRTKGGRRAIRPILFMCALAAARSKSRLGEFYQTLLKNGKKPMCALVALMRKIMVISNARIKERLFFGNSEQSMGAI